MAYLVLALLVLLTIAVMVFAIMARKEWNWYHVTCTITLMILCVIFLFPTAGALKCRSAWHQAKEKLEVQVVTLRKELKELKYGDGSLNSVDGIIPLKQKLAKASLDAGRKWKALRATGVANNQVTLVANIPQQDPNAVVGVVPGDGGDDGGEEAAAPLPLAETGAVVYAFADQVDNVSSLTVPSFYLGEYRVVSSTPNSVVLTPVASLRQSQLAQIPNSPQWTLYELLPADSHDVYLDSSEPTDNNILGTVNETVLNNMLANKLRPETFQSYREDGRRLQPDDPPLSRWNKIELQKPYKIDVDDTKLTRSVKIGGYYDLNGRAVDPRLKSMSEDGTVSFAKGENLLLKEEEAKILINEGTAKLVDEFYLRPLNDYRFILRRLQNSINESNIRQRELETEKQLLTEARKKTADMIVVQQVIRDKLEKDEAQFRVETQAIEAYTTNLREQLAGLQNQLKQMHKDNLRLEAKLEAFHLESENKLGGAPITASSLTSVR